MSIWLGNVQFNQVEKMLGYQLNEKDKKLWDKYHSNIADLSDKESCFHIFVIPRSIQFKGEKAKEAIIKMFTPDKITKSIGEFGVYEKEEK